MSKQLNLSEAATLVRHGEQIAISGGLEMAPMAFVRELIRQEVRGLHLVCSGSVALNADLLIGSGCVDTIELSHLLLGEYGFAPRFRKAAEEGSIRTLDHSCPGMASAFQAGALGIPFLPVHGLHGTDCILIRADFKTIPNPYNPVRDIVLVPAIQPDTAIFHGYEADTEGNVVTSSQQNNKLLAQASSRTIVTVERVVQVGQLDRSKGTFIPARYVTHVVEISGGAYPAACPGFYPADRAHIQAYGDAAKSEEGFRTYMNVYVLSETAELVAKERSKIGVKMPSSSITAKAGANEPEAYNELFPEGEYTAEEGLICALARELRDGETFAVGNQSAVPAAAAYLAKATHAPASKLLILGDATNWPFEGTDEFFGTIQRGLVDVFFLGGAQIDPYGSINLHMIGSIDKPRVRLPGGAGSALVYYRSRRVYLVKTDHQQKGFQETLDFISSHASPAHREPGYGKLAGVFTPIALLRPEGADGRLRLSSTAHGISVRDVQSRTGFALEASEDVMEWERPTTEELKVLRTIVREQMKHIYPEFTRGGIRHG